MLKEPTFHQAVIDHPADIDARLVYGDWLAEHGDSRGEFIQCEVAMERTPRWSPEYADLHYRAKYLSLQHRKKWDKEILDIVKTMKRPPGKRGFFGEVVDGRNTVTEYRNAEDVSFRYRFGFADHFEFRNVPRPKDLQRLTKVTPIRRLKLIWFNDAESRRLDTSSLQGVDQLDLFVRDNTNSLTKILSDGSNFDLTALRVYVANHRPTQWNNQTQQPSMPLAQLLANTDSLKNLTEFESNLGGGNSGDLERLVDSPAFANLDRLTLTEGDFGDAGMFCLAKSHLVKQLRYLKVKLSGIGDEGFKAFADAGPENLHTLAMGWWFGNNPTLEGFEALAHCPALSQLQCFDLRGWRNAPQCVAKLAQSTNLANLRMINFANTGFDDKCAEQLAASPHLRLHYLNLEANPKLTARGFAKLADSPVLEDLTYLHLRDCQGWGDEAAQLLANSKFTRKLRYLSLERSGLTITGVQTIANSANFSQLRQVDLGANISLDFTLLANSDELENLLFVNVAENGLHERPMSVLNQKLDNGVLLVSEQTG
jgi:uncharacterized protein (TIGR02996 family)